MDLNDVTVAVTGASGMLGAYIAEALAEANARVRAVVRNPAKLEGARADGWDIATADLMDRPALTEAMRGADVVVSNAALFRHSRKTTWADNYNANKTGTENVYHAMKAAGVTTAIQISTIGVYRWKGRMPLDEDAPQIDGEKREAGPYRASKQLSERIAWELANEFGIKLTVVRPGAIYGVRDPNLTRILRRMLGWPVVPVPAMTIPFVYARDVARAVVGAIANDDSVGSAFNTAGEAIPVRRFVRIAKRVLGRSLPLVVPSLPISRMVADNSRAARGLNFRCTPFEDGLREVFAREPL